MAEYEKIDGKKRLLAHVEENSPTFLVASDLDGTMMRNNSRLSEYTKDVLQRAIRRGIEFLPITGRSYRSAYDIIKDVDGIRYFLGGNASVITEFGTEKILKQWSISRETGFRIYQIIRELGGYAEVYFGNEMFSYNPYESSSFL